MFGAAKKRSARTTQMLGLEKSIKRPSLKDPGDDFVLELAVEAESDYIVTHNVKDFKDIMKFNIKAITPKQLLLNIGEIS